MIAILKKVSSNKCIIYVILAVIVHVCRNLILLSINKSNISGFYLFSYFSTFLSIRGRVEHQVLHTKRIWAPRTLRANIRIKLGGQAAVSILTKMHMSLFQGLFEIKKKTLAMIEKKIHFHQHIVTQWTRQLNPHNPHICNISIAMNNSAQSKQLCL